MEWKSYVLRNRFWVRNDTDHFTAGNKITIATFFQVQKINLSKTFNVLGPTRFFPLNTI